jgi:hypothetical protein
MLGPDSETGIVDPYDSPRANTFPFAARRRRGGFLNRAAFDLRLRPQLHKPADGFKPETVHGFGLRLINFESPASALPISASIPADKHEGQCREARDI